MNHLMPEPTQKEYHITAKVKFVEVDVKDHERQYKRKLVILIPLESTEQVLFYNAWLPDTREEYFELASVIKSGVPSPCRLAILRGKKGIHDGPYLHVMTKGVEEDFVAANLEGRTVSLTILPEDQDEIVDLAKDSGGDFDTIHGQETM